MMGNYIVSARKYRPKGFEEVVGQDHITTTLNNAIQQDQLAQALLFCGPRGVGKTTCARIVANKINGFDQEGEGSSTAMNIYELDAASNNSVDDIRNLIDQVRYPPQYGRYKVYIIDEVHMLSNQAFNAFLKTLEEPPPYAIFILATTEKHKVIPTILSRCQIFDFNRIDISDITNRIGLIAEKEDIDADPEALHLIAQKADGALRDALSLFDLIVTYASGNKVTYSDTAKNLHILDYDYYFKMTDHFLAENLSGSLLLFNEILKKGFDGQNFITGLSEHFRNLLVCKDESTIDLLEVSDTIKKKYRDQAKNAHKSFLLSALNLANQCDLNFKSSRNQRLHVEITLMKMTHLQAALKLSDLKPSKGEELKKKHLTRSGKTVPSKEKSEPDQDGSSNNDKQKPGKTSTQTENMPEIKNEQTNIAINKKTLKIPTIEDLNHHVFTQDTTSTETQVKEEIPIQNNSKKFTKEELDEIWQSYGRLLQEEEKNAEFNLMAKPFEIKEDHLIIIQIDNSLEEDILNRFRTHLTNYLRKKLENNLIRVETILNKKKENKKLYTNKDKFEFLARKNPNLVNLKNKFGLDIDF